MGVGGNVSFGEGCKMVPCGRGGVGVNCFLGMKWVSWGAIWFVQTTVNLGWENGGGRGNE